ncbi:MAG: hypothetical protein QOI65_2236 [Thermoleophilaceae bacterium]|nr:hypothetical protein [Thermoleophilaceae bacterium]
MRRALAVAATLLFGLAALPAAAVAADLGSTDMSQPVTGECPSYPCSVTDSVHADGTAETGSPIDGILTSVRLRYAGDGAAGVVRVLRDAGGGSFLNVGPEIPIALPASIGDVASFEVRRPIAAGDRLALGADASFDGDSFLADGSPRECLRAGPHAVDDTTAYSSCAAEVVLQGTVEPDADADGYGDATQDGCPTDAVIHDGPCAADMELTAAAESESLTLFDPATFTFTVTNHGTSPAKAAGLKVPVGDSAQLLSVTATAGRCGGVRAVFCWLGTLPAGASATATVVLLPSNAGALSVRSTVSSTTPDPNAGDNYATARTTITDPFVGVGLAPQTAVVKRGRARIVHSCPVRTPRFCQGEVGVARAAPGPAKSASGGPATRGPRLGSARFQLQPGAASGIPVKLTKRARRLLEERGRINVVVTTKAVDGAGTKRTSYGRVTLVWPSKTKRGR